MRICIYIYACIYRYIDIDMKLKECEYNGRYVDINEDLHVHVHVHTYIHT